MSAWWLVLAFVSGMAFAWKIAGRLLYYALGKRSLLFEQTLGKTDYDTLVRMRKAIDREISKREPKDA